jgi:folate-dependent tRNA-U54 methylase TrmFO/GidA
VVALDRHARPAGEADALDDVGIERALREKVRAADLLRFGLEHVDELRADELALLLGVSDALQAT